MKKPLKDYFLIVRFPCSYTSNDPEVDFYSVKASSEKAAQKIALRKAARRLRVIVRSVDGEQTNQYFD